jgi:hypothetical protein
VPNHITLEKKTGAEGFFDDALTYLFFNTNEETLERTLAEVRPEHIHFEVYTESNELEACDFRFYSVEKVEPPEEPADKAEEEEGVDNKEGGGEDA